MISIKELIERNKKKKKQEVNTSIGISIPDCNIRTNTLKRKKEENNGSKEEARK